MDTSQMQTVAKKEISGPSEARCECGQLVAKLGVGGIELKCKRCKRLVSIPFSSLSKSEVTFQLCENPSLSKTPV
jgi:phage FluMu protein Com